MVKISDDFPKSVAIEFTNHCNIKCPFCYRDESRKIGFMTNELFLKIIEECKSLGVKELGLNFSGESTLHPDFGSMLDKIPNDFLFNINTNGILMTKEIITKLYRLKGGKLNFSINYLPPLYKKIYNRDFSVLEENIKHAVDLKKEGVNVTGSMIFDSLVCEKDVDEFKLFCNKHKIDSYIGIYIKDMEFKQWPNSFELIEQSKFKGCVKPYQQVSVSFDGKLIICCSDLNAKVCFGDLSKNTMFEVWNSDEYKNCRKNTLDGVFKSDSLCSKCNLYKYYLKDD
jgi:MoaA/NifB/PqqE/SkfB family radical SAM enzyme